MNGRGQAGEWWRSVSTVTAAQQQEAARGVQQALVALYAGRAGIEVHGEQARSRAIERQSERAGCDGRCQQAAPAGGKRQQNRSRQSERASEPASGWSTAVPAANTTVACTTYAGLAPSPAFTGHRARTALGSAAVGRGEEELHGTRAMGGIARREAEEGRPRKG